GAAALLGPGPLRADAFVLESVYPTIREAVEGRLGVWLGPFGWLNRWAASLLIRGVGAQIGVAETALRPIDHIADAGAPVFVLSGTRDSYTPIAEARALFAQARGPKEFWAVRGAAHEDLYAFAGEAYEQRVGAFLATYLRAAPHRVAAASEAMAPSCGGATRPDPA
ncbi:MAG TPA: alpha/beta hydrolase, partial [Gemmatimonadaceae bacterium]|nr:alpha/beta hydrolase [Gemmatimonadaceae bacterium]